jgi:magnesium chelatase accessory protein
VYKRQPRLFAWRAADRAAVRRLVASTGSTLDARSVEHYARLVRCPGHVAGALAMMAHWDLLPLQRALPMLDVPLVLVAGTNDRTLPAAEAKRVQALLPAARLIDLQGLGHLAHEERPDLVAGIVFEHADAWGVEAAR